MNWQAVMAMQTKSSSGHVHYITFKLAPNCATYCNVCCGHSSGDSNHAVMMCFHFCCYIKRLFCELQAGIMVSFSLFQFWLIIVFCFAYHHLFCSLLHNFTFIDRFYEYFLCSVETVLRLLWDCQSIFIDIRRVRVWLGFGIGPLGKSRECWFARIFAINVNRWGAYLPWPLLCKSSRISVELRL